MSSAEGSIASPALRPPPTPPSPTSHFTLNVRLIIRSEGSEPPVNSPRMSSSKSASLAVASTRLIRNVPPIKGVRAAPRLFAGFLFCPGPAGCGCCGGRERLTISAVLVTQQAHSHPIPHSERLCLFIHIDQQLPSPSPLTQLDCLCEQRL